MSPATDSTLTDPQRIIADLQRELANAIAERDEALARETATSEVLGVINSSPGDLAPVFDAILEKAMRRCDAAFGGLWTFDRDQFICVASRGMPAACEAFFAANTMLPGPGTAPYRFLRAGERSVIEDMDLVVSKAYRAGDPARRALVDLGGARSALQVPLVNDDAVLGLITVYRQEVRPFTDKQIALLQNFASQAVIAMENARLITETREALERYSLVTQAAGEGVYEWDIIRNAVTASPRLLEIFGLSGAGFGTADWLELVHPDDLTGYRAAVRDCLRGVTPKLHHEYRARHSSGAYLWLEDSALPVRDEMGEALRIIGAVSEITDRKRGEADIREALEQQTATAEVLQVVNSSPGELKPVFDVILEKAMIRCEAAFGFLATYDGEQFTQAALRDVPDALAAYFAKGMDRPQPGESHWRLVQGEDVVHNLDQKDEEAYRSGTPLRRAVVDLGGARTALVVALRKDGVLLGGVTLYRKEVRPFTDHQIALVQNFAVQAVIAMENARLVGELRARTDDLTEALEYQTATSDALQVISRSTFDLQPVLDTLAQTMARLCQAEMAFILRRDGEVYRAAAAVGWSPEYRAFLEQYPIVPDRGTVTGRVVLEGRAVHVTDITADPEYILTEATTLGGARTQLGVPLVREGIPIGVIVLSRQRVEPFTERQIDLVVSFANQAVVAIENARLLGELRERTSDLQEALEYQTATADVLKVISRSTFDLQPVLDTLVETAVNLCEGQMAFIYRRDGELYRLVASFGFTPEYHAFMLSQPQRAGQGSMVGRVATTGRPVHIIDAAIDPEYTWTEARDRGGYRTMLGVPLLREGEPIGLISIVRAVVKPFSDAQIELMTAFADQAGIAIENARLIGELRAARDAAEKTLGQLRTAQTSLIQAEKMASLGQLTAGIAHEIKNPLNFVNNFASLSVELLDELKETTAPAVATLDEDKRADIDDTMELLTGNLEKIAEHGKRADNIVKSMLEHSRGASGERREVDLNGLIEDALNLAYHGARAHDQGFNITLERDYVAGLKPIEVAPQEMTRVFLNLIGNGFYAANKRAREDGNGSFRPVLAVATREDGDGVEVRVRDNGSGIPPEIKDKLFQPFFTTKPTGEGTGLGLSISYDIVTQQHGGMIEVASEEGVYTEFTIRLPRH